MSWTSCVLKTALGPLRTYIIGSQMLCAVSYMINFRGRPSGLQLVPESHIYGDSLRILYNTIYALTKNEIELQVPEVNDSILTHPLLDAFPTGWTPMPQPSALPPRLLLTAPLIHHSSPYDTHSPKQANKATLATTIHRPREILADSRWVRVAYRVIIGALDTDYGWTETKIRGRGACIVDASWPWIFWYVEY